MTLFDPLKHVNVSSEILFQELSLLTLEQMIQFELCKSLHKSYNSSLPKSLQIEINVKPKNSLYSLRSNDKILFPKYLSTKCVPSIANLGADVWNTLPERFKMLPYNIFAKT